MGQKYQRTDSWNYLPKGCFFYKGYGFYFNIHSSGKADSQRSRVCQVAGYTTTKAKFTCRTRANWTLSFPITNTSYMEKTTNLYSSYQFADKVTNQLGFRVQRAYAKWMNIEQVKFHDDIKYQLVDYTPFAPRTNAEFNRAAQQCSKKINCTLEGPYGPMEDWDVSDVTSMVNAFYGANSFNADISNWDVSNVRDMRGMFDGARSFNVDISKWNVGKVTTMRYMFYMATSFNVDLSSWNVWKVVDVYAMFYRAYAFNQKLCGPAWLGLRNKATNTTATMFRYSSGKFSCEKDRFAPESRKELNAALSACFKISSDGNCAKGKYNKQPAIGDWDVSDVQDLSYLFYQKTNFKADISKWNVANATNMEGMFAYARSTVISPSGTCQTWGIWKACSTLRVRSISTSLTGTCARCSTWSLCSPEPLRFNRRFVATLGSPQKHLEPRCLKTRADNFAMALVPTLVSKNTPNSARTASITRAVPLDSILKPSKHSLSSETTAKRKCSIQTRSRSPYSQRVVLTSPAQFALKMWKAQGCPWKTTLKTSFLNF